MGRYKERGMHFFRVLDLDNDVYGSGVRIGNEFEMSLKWRGSKNKTWKRDMEKESGQPAPPRWLPSSNLDALRLLASVVLILIYNS